MDKQKAIELLKEKDDIELLKDEYRKIQARKNLSNFTTYTWNGYKANWHHDVICDRLDRFAKGEIKNLMLFAPAQSGKLLSDDTKVITTKGWKLHKDLQVGDIVYGRNGEQVKIIAESTKDYASYEITFSDNEKIKCHEKHEWLVFDRNKKRERTIETIEIFEGLKNKVEGRNRFLIDANALIDFEHKDLDLHPYILGVWLGDGTAKKNCITYPKCDEAIVNRIEELGIKKTANTIHKDTGVYNSYFRQLYKKLKDLGFLNGDKYIPDKYKYNSKENRLQLLAGLIDTDGNVYQGNGRVQFSNTNKRLIDDTLDLCHSLGFRCSLVEEEPKTSTSGIIGRKKVYIISFNPDINIPTILERKKTNRLIKKHRRGIESIKKIKEVEGKCIQVEGEIYLVGRNMIPTHNSELSSRRFPAKMLGINPDLKIALVAYEGGISQGFNQDIQRIIMSEQYQKLYPEVKLAEMTKGISKYKQNLTEFEIVGHRGMVRSIGIGGALTSKQVDLLIMDDLYKDWEQAKSPLYRQHVINWYDSVAKKRLHNDSQQLMVFTRWDKQDLAGHLLAKERDKWEVLIFKSIREDDNLDYDIREVGQALWPERHGLEKLLAAKKDNPIMFACMDQQNPKPVEGLLYGELKKWKELPEQFKGLPTKCQVDTADTGKDNYAAVFYHEDKKNRKIYAVDIMYTKEDMRKTTEQLFIKFLDNNCGDCEIEINKAGTALELALKLYMKMHNDEIKRKIETLEREMQIEMTELLKLKNTQKITVQEYQAKHNEYIEKINELESQICNTKITGFHQSKNKVARIFANATNVIECIYMPPTWEIDYPEAYNEISGFIQEVEKNVNDDMADTLTRIVEKIGKRKMFVF